MLQALLPLPYIGLRAFEETDHLLLFGREAQVVSLLRKLEDRRFVAVVGSSGSGKSSLVRAGLLPALREGFMDGYTDWLTLLMRPGSRPYERLADAVTEATASELSDRERQSRVEQLRRSDRGLLEVLEQ